MNQSIRNSVKNEIPLQGNDFYARLIAQHSTDSIVLTDREGLTVWCNLSFTKMSGYMLAEMLGRKPGSVLQGTATEPATVLSIHNALQERREIQTEIVNYSKSGDPYWIELRITPIFDEKGTHTHFMSIERDVTIRKDLEKRTGDMIERERRSKEERRLLTLMSEWLYSAKSMDEVLKVIRRSIQTLFPESFGALYIFANSRNVLDLMATWGEDVVLGATAPAQVEPDGCWSLRRGRAYHFGSEPIEFQCDHVGHGMRRYICVPVIAHGETIGLLYLAPNDAAINSPETDWSQRWDLALLCGEQISLALANVRLRQQLMDQSVRDQLTSLSNRRWFLDAAHREIERASKTGVALSLISLDVDHFKRFNDNHGHDAGDTVLREMGKLMAEFFQNGKYPCRIGGEEFVVLCPGLDKAAALSLGDEFRASVSGLTLIYGGVTLPSITVSGGVASYPQDGMAVIEMLKTADEALYRAKTAGRDRIIAAGAPDLARPNHATGQSEFTDEGKRRL